ncbi:MAG: Stp1/IreP family PP2C-type Ser/Thr phosphatase [Methylococcales bacterium]
MYNTTSIQTETLYPAQSGLYERSESFDIAACMVTDVGCVREENEDRILYVKPSDPQLQMTKGILAVVADGMGGHQAGAVASQLAVETIKRHYYNNSQSPQLALQQALISANQYIREYAQSDQQFSGMGTTASALVLQQGAVYTAHVGDSRLYLIRNNRITQLTEDHSMVMQMVKEGLITAEQARQHPDNNIINRALGTQDYVEVAISTNVLYAQSGDRFVLSSDGLHDLVDDEEILQATRRSDIHQTCHQLITQARDRGGYDNISVGIVAINPVGEKSARAPQTRSG